MDLQTTLEVKVFKGIGLSNEELDSLKYLLEEFGEWRKAKSTLI